MGIVWQVTPDQAFTELVDAYENEIHDAIKQIADRYAPDIEAWMKSNAPWTDRTSNARQSLKAEVLEDFAFNLVTIFLSYGATIGSSELGELDYGIFLELSNGGRYAIISPALDEFGPKIWADVQRLFK